MRARILAIVASAITGLVIATFALAGPGISITKTAPLSGTGSDGSPLKITVCANGETYQSNGTSWACATAGDITGVTAGSGLTGGGTSGAVTLAVGAGSGITASGTTTTIDPTYTQRRVTGTCTGNDGVLTVAQDGTVTCASGTGDITSVVAGTGLSGGATSGAATLTVNIAGASCAASEAITALGATGTGTCTTVGDITSVVAGTGLSGGATSGAATLTVNVAGASCSAGSFMSALGATGTGTCTAATSIVTGTTNTMAKFTSSTAVGNSSVTDDATTFAVNTNKFTVTESSGNTQVAGTFGSTGAATLSSTLGVTGLSTLTGGYNSSAGPATVGAVAGTVLEPTISSTPQNNYAPTNLATATILAPTAASPATITGLDSTGVVAGRMLLLHNAGAGLLTLSNESGSSTAANRFTLYGAANVLVGAGNGVWMYYSTTTSRWIVLGMLRFGSVTVDSTLGVAAGTTTLKNAVIQGFTATGQTATTTAEDVAQSGTYNATGVDRLVYGVKVTSTASRSAGANSVYNYSYWGSASGGQFNYAAYLEAGDLQVGGTLGTGASHIVEGHGTAPALTSCGTSPTITGSDVAGTVTEGTIATGCTITFYSAYANAPTCTITSESSLGFTYTTSTTAITITNVGALSSTKVDYHCIGH